MVLNLLRVDEVDPEYLMQRSFHQFQNDRALPEMEQSTSCNELCSVEAYDCPLLCLLVRM